MRFMTQVQGAATDFETRKEHDQQLDQVLADLCTPSATWNLSTVIRAILIYYIMSGEDVRAEDIIADKIVRMAQGIKEKGKLGFPSTIYKLCKEAGGPLREFRRTRKIQAEKPITARRMESTRLPRPVQRRHSSLNLNTIKSSMNHQCSSRLSTMFRPIQINIKKIWLASKNSCRI
ncbi:hypothetical protein PIB30_083174 [Stylosanthes scabra]|uniref:Uncharacterized protein n=1 Tax=Stylosanthes scabra TaxID=79078 RepID=A0ABU6WQG4_9FABA|nr:hypothetical protein [Stylosanthes scabra]